MELEKENGNKKLISELINNQAKRLTRLGQELQSQVGVYDKNSARYFINKLLDIKRNFSLQIEYKEGSQSKEYKGKYENKVSEKAKEIRKNQDLKMAKIQKAEDIINSIIC